MEAAGLLVRHQREEASDISKPTAPTTVWNMHRDQVAGHAVYLLYDARDRVIYVGYSIGILGRLASQFRSVRWWRAECRCFETHDAAVAEEERLIKHHKPRLNKAGTKGCTYSPPGNQEAIRDRAHVRARTLATARAALVRLEGGDQ